MLAVIINLLSGYGAMLTYRGDGLSLIHQWVEMNQDSDHIPKTLNPKIDGRTVFKNSSIASYTWLGRLEQLKLTIPDRISPKATCYLIEMTEKG